MSSLHILYGGTFDPVHNGHLAIARAARDTFQSTVFMMPAADPPHRAAPGASAQQRVDMLQLATATMPHIEVDLRELQRQGRSYTIDTLRELRQQVGEQQALAIMMGADSFLDLPTWKEWKDLFDYAHIIVAERPGSPLQGQLPSELADVVETRWATQPEQMNTQPSGLVMCLDQPLYTESATQVRQNIAEHRPWRHLVPALVADYIEASGLYR